MSISAYAARVASRTFKLAPAALALALLSATAQPLLAHDYTAGAIHIAHPWSRATPEGARVAAGYFVLKNTGTEADRLVSVESEIAGRTEIHDMTVNAEGVMTMRALADGIEVPAGAEVALRPGSYHVMFMELKTPPQEGKRFAGTLTFEKAGTVDVEFAVEAMGGGSGHDAHEDHGGHDGHDAHDAHGG